MKRIFIILSLLVSACTSLSPFGGNDESNELIIKQKDQTIRLSRSLDNPLLISLKPKNFSIQTGELSKDIPIQICVTSKQSVLQEIKRNRNKDRISCFTSGTGMAMQPIAYPRYGLPLYISEGNAHNYYSSDRRANDKSQTAIYINDASSVGDGTLPDFSFMVVIIDKNEDDVIQNDEFWTAKINWN